MKGIGVSLWIVLLILAVHAGASELVPPAVLEMADAPGRVDQQKVNQSMIWAVRELNLGGQSLPFVAVFHVSLAAAKHLGIEGTSLWQNRGGNNRYELWIVGEPSNRVYSLMAVNVLERHFALGLDEASRTRAVEAVCRRLDSTVNASAIKPRSHAWK